MDIPGAAIFLISTIASLYVLLLLLRFLLRISDADYYNPLSQGIVQITNPVVKPVSLVIPSVGRVDFPTLLVAVLVELIALMLVALILGSVLFQPVFIGWALVGVLSLTLDIYFFALLIMVLASWIAPGSGHPILTLATQITEPLVRPARNLIPSMGGLDFSIMAVIIGLMLLDNYLLIPQLVRMLPAPEGLQGLQGLMLGL